MSRSKQIMPIHMPRTKLLLPFLCGFSLIGIFFSTIATADISAVGQPGDVDADGKPKFFYQLDGRPDPFVPFITPQAAAAKVDMNEIVDVDGPLTGMQLFEPGQLTLVALMVTGTDDTAMVEDFTGKGYILSEGTKIGKRGVVKDIVPNKVIIEETAFTRAGKKIINELVMILKKEGEE